MLEKFVGKGVLMVNVNGTENYLSYKDNNDLKELLERVFIKQGLKPIKVVDFEERSFIFIDDQEDYENIMKGGDFSAKR